MSCVTMAGDMRVGSAKCVKPWPFLAIYIRDECIAPDEHVVNMSMLLLRVSALVKITRGVVMDYPVVSHTTLITTGN